MLLLAIILATSPVPAPAYGHAEKSPVPMVWSGTFKVPPCYGDGHNAHRSREARAEFMRSHPCPAGPNKGSTAHCRGWDVDHVCPLACCGLDAASNMQWLTHAANEAKGDDCSACKTKGIR